MTMIINDHRKKQFSNILEKLSEALDITPTQHESAVEKYEAVGKWLAKEDSSLKEFNPAIYPQGSFALGTVTKPASGEDQYDIDLVCLLQLSTKEYTQKQLKEMVGNRLAEHGTYKKMLDEEGRRCWTLKYAESTRFHMDILPSAPDNYQWLIRKGVPPEWAEHAICITDNKAFDYDKLSPYWHKSNPKGYAMWFKERMKVQFKRQVGIFAQKHQMNVEEVQEYQIKTPLQRAIQLLKRHRDIMFGDDENRPISIIITTLAAKAYKQYNQQENLYDVLIELIDEMPKYIEDKQVNGKTVKWVGNPVNPLENFADKWERNSKKQKSFYRWLSQVRIDLQNALKKEGLNHIAAQLKLSFGEKDVNKVINAIGEEMKTNRENGKIHMAAGTGILSTSGKTQVKNHTFYGEEKK